MEFNKQYINILIRITLLLINSLLLTYELVLREHYHGILLFSILIIIQSFLLINYIHRINNTLYRFITALNEGNANIKLPSSFKKLNTSLERMAGNFQQMQIEKESNYYFLNNIINHVDIVLICYYDSGIVRFANKEAIKLLKNRNIKKLNNLKTLHENLPKLINNIESQESIITKITISKQVRDFLIKKISFKLLDERLNIVSLIDVQKNLFNKEIEAWHKLIRVLSHEIEGSISPITSLSDHLADKFSEDDILKRNEQLHNSIGDITQTLDLISSRGKDLLSFINNYRSLLHIPEGHFKNVLINDIIHRVYTLISDKISEKDITFNYEAQLTDLQIFADSGLVEQVLINLICNSIDAIEGNDHKLIKIKAFKEYDNVIIEIIDNGSGIDEKQLDQIFIPFYSTKEKGSGIGLSLSVQIMRLHGGSLQVRSIPGLETVFTMVF